MGNELSTIEALEVPETMGENQILKLIPVERGEDFYRARIDRNLGWITWEEQQFLRDRTIGIAGCGGMGGLLAQIFFRLGVGEVRIADPEVFDTSNLNRQYAARQDTVGKSKALETARGTRAVIDDATLVVYPQGICEGAVDHFLDGCDVVCDEIEFWAVGARILLHQKAREKGISLFNCNTVGFGTRLFFFEPDGYTMEQTLGLELAEATELQNRIRDGSATAEEKRKVMLAVLVGLVPELPEYCPEDPAFRNHQQAYQRLVEEGRAMIISTNPPMATGFLADHMLLHLLQHSTVRRTVTRPPKAPGYLYFDAACMKAKVEPRKEVHHDRHT